jgi:hypothetical protein
MQSRPQLIPIAFGIVEVRIFRFLLGLVTITILACLIGCRRAPDEFEYVANVTRLLDQYLNTNASGAGAAMLELEKYTRECERLGSREIKFNQHYAAIYSRLYLVEKALGKDNAAAEHYRKATEYWRKEFTRRGLPDPGVQEIREQIEHVDRYLVEPQWKGEPVHQLSR